MWMLESLGKVSPEELLANWRDGRIKLFLTQRLLSFRRDNSELFQQGTYIPLTVTGEFADCCIAFARVWKGRSHIVLTPRLTTRIGFPPLAEAWRNTSVQLPEIAEERKDLFTGEVIQAEGDLQLARALARLPFAVIS